LPERFGPTMAVKPLERGMLTLEFPNDLKPRSSILLTYTTFHTLGGLFTPLLGQPPKIVLFPSFAVKNFSFLSFSTSFLEI